MKKLKIFLATLVAVLSFGLVACSGNTDLYKVTFMDGTSVVFELNKGKGEYLDSLPNAPAKEGYVFDGWYADANLTVPYKSDVLSNDLTLYAKYIASEYMILFNVDGGEELSPLSVKYGETYELPTPVKEGYSFVEWTLDGITFPATGVYEKTSAVKVKANWEVEKNVVTYLNGQNVLATEEVVYNDTAKGWNSPNAGYHVEGIYTDEQMTVLYQQEKITKETNLYVKILPNEYTITINGNGGLINGEEIFVQKVTFEQAYTLPSAEREGYEFLKFVRMDNGNDFDASGNYNITSNLNVKAVWDVDSYRVNYYLDGEIVKFEDVEYNSLASGWDNTDAGYRVEGIYSDQEFTQVFDLSKPISGNIDLYVKVVPCVYTITVRLNGGTIDGSHDVEPIEVEYKAQYVVPTPSRADYSFLGYKTSGGRDFEIEGTYNYTSNVTIIAEWKSLVADSDQDGEELFIKKNNYFKIRNNTSEAFTFVFLTGIEYNFTNYIVNASNAGANVQAISDSSFKALSACDTFDLVLTRIEEGGSITYNRKAMIVESVRSFGYGENYLLSWGNKDDSNFRSDFIDKKVDQNLAVGYANFIPDIKILNVSLAQITLEQANLNVIVKIDGNNTDDFVVDSNGTISFGADLVGRTAEVIIAPIYDIYDVTPVVFTIDINDGENVYTDSEMRAAYENLSVSEINVLRNITATVAPEDTVNSEGVYSLNTYAKGSAYTRETPTDNDVITINGNFFEINADAKLVYDGDKEVGFTSSLPLVNNDYCDRDWSVSGDSGYYIANVQNGFFAYLNKIDDGSETRKHNGQFTVNDLRIIGNAVGEMGLLEENYKGSNHLLVKAQTYHGIVVRGGTANINNTTISNTNIAIFGDSEVSVNKDEDGNQTQAVHFNINKVKTFDNFANSIYAYRLTEINIKESQFGKSTSAIISVDDYAYAETVTSLTTEINVDSATTFNNFVSGDEAWFVGYGKAPIAIALKQTVEGSLVNPGDTGEMTVLRHGDNNITLMNFIIFVRSVGSETSDWLLDAQKKPYVTVTGLHDTCQTVVGSIFTQGKPAPESILAEGTQSVLSFNSSTNQAEVLSHLGPTQSVGNPEAYMMGYIEIFSKTKTEWK